MALIKAATFESGDLTGSDAFDTTAGASIGSWPEVTTVDPLVGSRACLWTWPALSNIGQAYGTIARSGGTNIVWYTALYVRFDRLPSVTTTFLQPVGSLNQDRAQIRITPSGVIEALFPGEGSPFAESGAITLGVIYRLELFNNSADGMVLRLATGDGAASTVGTHSQSTNEMTRVRYGNITAITGGTNTSVVMTMDEVRLDNAAIPALPSLPVAVDPPATPTGLVATWQSATSINVTWNSVGDADTYDLRRSTDESAWTDLEDVTSPHLDTGRSPETTYFYQVRACNAGGCSDWSASASATTPSSGSVTFLIRGGVTVGGRIEPVSAEPEKAVSPRGGVLAGGRINVNVHRNLHLRGGVIIGGRVRIGEAQARNVRGGVIVGGRISITVESVVRLRAGVIVGGRSAIQLDRQVRIRGGVIVGARDAYVGPGSGVVAAGMRFTVNALREGDTFAVWLPWAGLAGVNGLAHVMSRTARDDRQDQEVELAIVETPGTRDIPRMRGGARPKPSADSTDAMRRQSRQEREIDKLDRNRG